MKSISVLYVHILWHFFHYFCQLVEIQLALIFIFVKFSGCVALTKILKIIGNTLESHTNVSISVFVQNLIVLIERQSFFLFPKVNDFVVSDILQIIEQRPIVIVSD